MCFFVRNHCMYSHYLTPKGAIRPSTPPNIRLAIVEDKLAAQGKKLKFLVDGLHNTKDPVPVRCLVCDYVWDASPSNLVYQKGCKCCNGKIRFNTVTYQEELNRRGILMTVLGEYINNKHPIDHQCGICNYIRSTSPSVYLKKDPVGCPSCSGVAKVTTEEYIQRLAKANPHIELYGPFLGMGKKSTHRCTKGDCNYIWDARTADILDGVGCPRCSKKEHRTGMQFCREIAISNPTIKLRSGFEQTSKKAFFECLVCSHQWWTIAKLIMRGHGCPFCTGCNPMTKKLLEEAIGERPITILSDIYDRNRMKFGCRVDGCGHTWYANPLEVKYGTGCKKCVGLLAYTNESYQKKIKGRNITFLGNLEPGKGSMRKYHKHYCSTCNSVFDGIPTNIISGTGCIHCEIDSNALYYWIDANGMTKIGITKFDLGNKRINGCASNRKTTVKRFRIIKIDNAISYERDLLKNVFPDKQIYTDGDGYTEFRNLDENDLQILDKYFDQLEKSTEEETID